jgi:hypothetical protein
LQYGNGDAAVSVHICGSQQNCESDPDMEDPFLDPARWIVSNDLAAARYPVSPGHTLIVPRRPVPTVFDCNCGADARQTIFRAHVHLIPRYRGDHPNPRGGVWHIIPGKGDYPTD